MGIEIKFRSESRVSDKVKDQIDQALTASLCEGSRPMWYFLEDGPDVFFQVYFLNLRRASDCIHKVLEIFPAFEWGVMIRLVDGLDFEPHFSRDSNPTIESLAESLIREEHAQYERWGKEFGFRDPFENFEPFEIPGESLKTFTLQ